MRFSKFIRVSTSASVLYSSDKTSLISRLEIHGQEL